MNDNVAKFESEVLQAHARYCDGLSLAEAVGVLDNVRFMLQQTALSIGNQIVCPECGKEVIPVFDNCPNCNNKLI